jgi:hypothetical protein
MERKGKRKKNSAVLLTTTRLPLPGCGREDDARGLLWLFSSLKRTVLLFSVCPEPFFRVKREKEKENETKKKEA